MIPISTTTVTIRGRRPQSPVDPDAEGYDGPQAPAVELATGVRASITLPGGLRSAPRDQVTSYAFRCDPFGAKLTRHDIVVDEQTGTEYVVDVPAVSLYTGFAMEHWLATLKLGAGIYIAEDTNAATRD
jgi:hypothetical protein